MARSSDSFNKRDNEKKKLQKRKEKEQRKEERKSNGKEGKTFEQMLAYVDENGNLTSTPPDPFKKKVIKESDIELTSRNKGGNTPNYMRTGMIKFFDTSKGFGFVKDDQSAEEYFFYHKSADYPVAQFDRVSFETEMGPKGQNAVRISKVSDSKPAEAKPSEPKAAQ
jgi:cold shock CspA family protein